MMLNAPDFIGRSIDAAVPLAIGVFGLFYYPSRIEKDIKSGKRSEAEAKPMLKKLKIIFGLTTLLGIYLSIELIASL